MKKSLWVIVGCTLVLSFVAVRYLVAADKVPQGSPTLVSTYNTDSDASLAKELVRIAEAQRSRVKTFQFFQVGVETVRDSVGHFERLETDGGYVIGIEGNAAPGYPLRVVFPARKITHIDVVHMKE
jgi:hypothetical protein